MKRTGASNKSCHALLGMLISCVLVGALARAALGDAADSGAPSAPGVEFQSLMVADPLIAVHYLSLGYAVCGPVKVCTFAPPDFQIWVPRGALRISLENKRLSVLDVEGREFHQSAVGKGTEVYVCRKAQQLFVIVLGQQEGVE